MVIQTSRTTYHVFISVYPLLRFVTETAFGGRRSVKASNLGITEKAFLSMLMPVLLLAAPGLTDSS